MGTTSESNGMTKKAERDDAARSHTADRAPTSDEEAAAERSRTAFENDEHSVAEHYEEMADLGAHVKGEGQID
jgi:hypothetical protein